MLEFFIMTPLKKKHSTNKRGKTDFLTNLGQVKIGNQVTPSGSGLIFHKFDHLRQSVPYIFYLDSRST